MPLTIWPAALALSAWLIPRDFRTFRCIELGAGTGFLSLSLAKAGVLSQVLITDGEEKSVELIRSNIALNEGVEAEAAMLDWNHCPDSMRGEFEMVLGSDVM